MLKIQIVDPFLFKLFIISLSLIGFFFFANVDFAFASDLDISFKFSILENLNGFSGNLDYRDEFGFAIESLGDLDGNGFDDFAVGAQRDDDGSTDFGAVWILFMNGDATVKTQQKISATEGGISGLSGFGFGSGLAKLGDLDGDGITELAVTSLGPTTNTIWILFLNNNGTVKTHHKITNGSGDLNFTLGSNAIGALGIRSLEGMGDIDLDGVPDMVVGAHDYTISKKGAVFVFFLRADGSVKSYTNFSFGNFGDRFGASVTNIGDVDLNGTDDIAIGGFQTDGAKGAVWLTLLNNFGQVVTSRKISSTSADLANPIETYESIGSVLNTMVINGKYYLLSGSPALNDNKGSIRILPFDESLSISNDRHFKNEYDIPKMYPIQGEFGKSIASFVDPISGSVYLLVGAWMDQSESGGIMVFEVEHNINQSPVLTTTDQSTAEGTELSFTISATDADNDPLTYSATNLPGGASFDPQTQTFSWTPEYNAAGIYEVVFSVTDGELSDIATATIEVLNTNRAPILEAIGNQTTAENQNLSFTISATDPDGDSLTYSAANLPAGATFDPQTQSFNWTPGYNDAGNYADIEFTVTDEGSPMELDVELVTVTVGDVNRAPEFVSPGAQEVLEDNLLSFSVSASDPDNDAVSLSALGLPSGASFDAQRGEFLWTPNLSQEGIYTVTFTATDSGTPIETGSIDVVITVGDNPTPVEQSEDIIEDVIAIDLPTNVENSYMANLQKVADFIEQGKIQPAINQLNAFISKVEQDYAQGILTQQERDDLVGAAEDLIDEID